jgi:AcrR family transcriptional regulator
MDESKQEIIDATRAALKKQGYTSLSIQKIADEFDKSKSLLYHHYKGKDEILLDFMDHTLEELSECCMGDSGKESEAELEEEAFIGFKQDRETAKAMTDLRAQAVRKKEYRERFQNFSNTYKNRLIEIFREGRKKEVFNDNFNPEKAATFIDAINKEAIFTEATGGRKNHLRSELENYLKNRIKKK